MHGLYLLFWVQEKQVSPAVVAAGLALGDLAIVLFEIPTGWIADRWGSRASLITGSLVQLAGMLACWFAPGLYSVVAGTLVIALGDALRSGANQALLYRSCAALGRVDEFLRIEAATHAATQVALVLLVLLGGAIVQRWGFAAGWLSETVLCAVGAVLAMMMEAPPPVGAGPRGDQEEHTIRTPWHLLRSRRVLRTILPASLIGASASATSFLAQTAGDASPASVTWLVAALALAEAIGAAVAPRPVRSSLLLTAAGLVVVVTAVQAPLLPFAAMVLAVLEGAAYPGRAAAIQSMASDAVRAQAASLASACDMAVRAVALPLTSAFRARCKRP